MLRLERTTLRGGHITREVEYAITSLARDRAGAASCSLCGVASGASKCEHWIRDTHSAKTAAGSDSPTLHNLAAFRNAAINLLRLANTTNLAAALRENAYRVERLFARLGIIKL